MTFTIKPLEWHGPDFEGEYWAAWIGGKYTIQKPNGNGMWLGGVGGYFQTVEEAKAAAEADYRQRILSTLLPKATAPVVSEPVAWCNTTMSAIATLSRSVDGAFSTKILAHAGKDPKGEMQDYEGPHVAGVTHEWVDQSGPGMSGDDFSGTVTFVLGDFHLVVEYAT